MAIRTTPLDERLAALSDLIGALPVDHDSTTEQPTPLSRAIERVQGDIAATRYHLARTGDARPIVVLLGGTGTGKSTLLNRLLGAELTAASFRRTFTAGPVAIAAAADSVPGNWLGVPHHLADLKALPVKGEAQALVVIVHDARPTQQVILVDTPDLDGDQPAHHAQADRAFRWADAVVFLVTPEKYQMTELLPYYRLAARYRTPALYVMNKAESQAVVEDFATQLRARSDIGAGHPANLFAIPRDDAGYEPAAEMNANALRAAITELHLPDPEARRGGARQRGGDVLGRVRDQIVAPLREDRAEVDRLTRSLRAMEASVDVDVNPLTSALQRRLQQRSILYLMGPGRMLDRVRQVPALLARLPRTTWDLLSGGGGRNPAQAGAIPENAPDFRAALLDQFAVVQSRIDDVIGSSPRAATWMASANYADSKLAASEAGRIADEELESLKQWMTQRWNATPRDTAMIARFIRHLPGGKKLTAWSEAAPYVLAAVVAMHHALFGPVDLMVVGGFSLATWLTEKVSNEVTAHARATNKRLAERFTVLAHQQIERSCRWLEQRMVKTEQLDALEKAVDETSAALERF